MAGESRAQVTDTVAGVADALHRAVDVELSPVIGWGRMLQLDEEIPERLILAGVFFIAGPETVDVELDSLGLGEAEDHATERAVAERQSLGHPRAGGLGIPEGMRRRSRRLADGMGRENDSKGDQGETEHTDVKKKRGYSVMEMESDIPVRPSTMSALTPRCSGDIVRLLSVRRLFAQDDQLNSATHPVDGLEVFGVAEKEEDRRLPFRGHGNIIHIRP